MKTFVSMLLITLALVTTIAAQSSDNTSGLSATEAIQMMKDGNKRFVSGNMQFPNLNLDRVQETVAGQHPYAVVLACSDSRVPIEATCDAGIGELYVVRVAGNVAGPDAAASIEYAVESLDIPLLVVMGHSGCGTISTAISDAEVSGPMEAIIARIRPVAEQVAADNPTLTGKKLVSAVAKANVWRSIEDLLNQSPALCKRVKAGKLTVQGALYSLTDGKIAWLGAHARQAELVAARLAMAETPAPVQVTASVPATAPAPAPAQATPAPAPAPATPAPAPEPSKLSLALDKLEATMKGQPQQSPAVSQPKAMAQVNQTPTGDVSAQINELRTQLLALQAQVAASAVSESTLVHLTTDLNYALAQIEELRPANEALNQKLASLEDIGVVPTSQPDNADLDRLATLVTELNTNLEKNKTAQAQPFPNSAAIKHGTIALSGFIHQQYYNKFGDTKQSTFNSKRARIGVLGNLNSYSRIDVWGDFAATPKLIEGYVTVTPHKQLAVRFGQLKVPFGTEAIRSGLAWPFVNPAQLYALTPDRDLGITATFDQKVSPLFAFNLWGGVVNGAGINATDANTNKNLAVRSEMRFYNNMFVFAPNAYFGKTNDTGIAIKDFTNVGASLSWNWKREVVELEYINSEVGDVNKEGWYVWGGHTLPTNWKFLPEIQFAARYDQYNPNVDAVGDKLTKVTLGTNLFMDKRYTVLQLSYQINGEETTSVSNNELLANFQVGFF